MTTLLELAERCEREGPSRELMHLVQAHARDWAPSSPLILISLDAAVAFVERALPGCNWCLTKDKEADVEWGAPREERWFHSPRDNGGAPRVFAATPALALVSAALRALAARDGA